MTSSSDRLSASPEFTMTAAHWQTVDAIVGVMRSAGISKNELKKIVAYIHWWRNRHLNQAIGDHLFDYLTTLVNNGPDYSGSAKGYREKILTISRQSLDSFKHDTESVIQILGWAARLV